MKAAVRHEYGPPEVLTVEEVQTPTPLDDELLVRVHAASVNLGDWELLTGRPRYLTVLARIFGPKPRHRVTRAEGDATSSGHSGLFKPRYKILGSDIAGTVEAVGKSVTRFHTGDEIFGDCSMSGFGAFADYVCVPETNALAAKPPGMTFEQAAAIPQATFIALQGLRDKAQIQPGQKVLINGAGGGAGTFAVQLAKTFGAEVTAVDGPSKLAMLRSIGADHVIDYNREDFTKTGQRYDVILDLAAYRSVFETRRSLTPSGLYMMAGGAGPVMSQTVFIGPMLSLTGKGRVSFLIVEPRSENLTFMTELFDADKAVPVIDACYPLVETGEAIRCLGEKQSKGKVIITP